MAKKTTTRKKAPSRTSNRAARTGSRAPGAKSVPEAGVRVRMYRHGFGDCFLLSFGRGKGNAPFHMVIDCGLLPGSPGEDRVKAAAADILQETGGRIDVLVCTHEHADHLSGFLIAGETWDKIAVDELWFAWTEDPGDPLATRLRRERDRRLVGLQGVSDRLQHFGATSWGATAAQEVNAALSFFGAGPGRGGARSTTKALEYVRTKVARPRYFKPGAIEAPGNLPGVRMFVLGPPRSEAALRKDAPTAANPEVYHVGEDRALTSDAAFFAAAGADPAKATDEDRTCAERAEPFEAGFRVARAEVARAKASHDPRETAGYLHMLYESPTREEEERTLVGDRTIRSVTRTLEQGWRRIDEDWLGVAGSMALKLDSDTNNTSLVLAIELVESGRVLLFPGDAQVGNWLSWDECRFEVRASHEEEKEVDAADLLARTVLYKVGHHGSHNATLKEKGLERMRSKDLVAMIPVVERVAAAQGKHGWKMPFGPLLSALEDHTDGRVLRVDAGVPGVKQRWFQQACSATDLYIDMVIADS